MLTDQRIVSLEDARALRKALDGIALDSVRAAAYDGSCEDLFFFIERLIRESCGDDVAGRLHTARSRNDIDITMYRIRQREFIALLGGYRKAAFHTTSSSCLRAQNSYGRPHKNKRSYVHAQASW